MNGARPLAPVAGPPRDVLWMGAALGGAALLGYWISRDAAFLHIGGTLDLRAGLALATGFATAAAIVRWPACGLVLLVGAVYLNLSQVLVRDHGFPSFLQLLAAPLLLAALLERRGHTRPRVRPTAPLLAAGFALAVLGSTTVAADRVLADARMLEVAKGVLLVLLLALLVGTPKRMRVAAWTLVGAAALLAGLAALQSLMGGFDQDFGGLARVKYAHIHGSVFQPRAAGPLGDPNFFAQILVVAIPMAIFLGWEESSPRRRAAAWAAAAVIAVGVVLTYSRGGALALGVVLAGAVLVRGVNPRRLLVGALVLGAASLVLPREFTARVATVVEVLPGGDEDTLPEDSSFRERMLLAGVAWEMFRERPFRGVGAGNYTVHFDDFTTRVASSTRDYGMGDATRYAHNLYLELAAEGGVPVVATFLALMGWAFLALLGARVAFLRSGDPFMAGMAAAVALGLTGYLVSSLFLHGHFQRYLWLIVGLAAALSNIAVARTSESSPHGPPAPTAVSGGAT